MSAKVDRKDPASPLREKPKKRAVDISNSLREDSQKSNEHSRISSTSLHQSVEEKAFNSNFAKTSY